jgi:hypothetical protein
VSVISADFNNDNKQDLAVANNGDNSLSVLIGNGNGTFQTPMKYTVGNGPSSVISADFNNDSGQDLAVSNQLHNTVSVLLGNGNGTFQAPMNYVVGKMPSSVTSADFNNDNNQDLAVANKGANTISLLYGNGNGTFQSANNFGGATETGNSLTCVISGDLNDDNKPDLISTNSGSGEFSVLLNGCTNSIG